MYLTESWVDQHSWVPGLAIGVIAIMVSLAIALWGRATTTLDYATVSETRVLTESVNKLGSEIAVTVNGKTVSRPRFVTIRYKNSGRKEIRDKQYSDGVGLSDVSGVVGVEIAGVASKDMKLIQIGLVPNLRYSVESLNRGEWFDIQYLVDDSTRSGKLVPAYRVDGQTRPPKAYGRLSGITLETVTLFAPVAIMTAVGAVANLVFHWAHNPVAKGLVIVAAVAVVLGLAVGYAVLRNYFERRHPEVLRE